MIRLTHIRHLSTLKLMCKNGGFVHVNINKNVDEKKLIDSLSHAFQTRKIKKLSQTP